MRRRILITGASIAGNTAAFWLGQQGHDVTVVERARAFRDGGQNVDIRGVGREIMRRMGLEQAALASGTGEEGTAFIDADGHIKAQFINAEMGREGPTAEMEILRGDLAKLICEPAAKRAAYRFGDSIRRIDDGTGHALVTFASGQSESYDLVIVAEGVGSPTRDLVFARENEPRWMDLTMAFFTIPRLETDDRLWRWYSASGGRSISLRPDRYGTTRAMLSIHQPPGGEQQWGRDRQQAFLRQRFSDAGWQASRVLLAMERTEDFYFDVLRQVRMPRWSKQHVVLTGDAAWCTTPLGGIGATLAVTGAYVLAGELLKSDDLAAALVGYERAMRPMVEQGQSVPKIGPRLMHPRSRFGIKLLHRALSVMSGPTPRAIGSKLFGREDQAPDLSAYPSRSSSLAADGALSIRDAG